MHNKNCKGLSVIIPVYNSEKYLANCLDSIINQEYKNLEIICVNDGSTDSSAKILDDYANKDDRIVVVHNENKGAAAARNCGIEKATMPYIAFVDSDDTIDSKMYSEMIREISEKNLDCVCSNYKKVFADGTNKVIESRFDNSVLYNEEIVKGLIGFKDLNNNCLSSLWNKIFKLEILNKNQIRINEKRSHGEDWLFCIEYYAVISSIGFLEGDFYNYIFRQNSLVSKPRNNVFELAIETSRRFKVLFPDFEWQSERIIFEENNRPIETALYYRKMFNKREGDKLLNQIFSICKVENYYFENNNLNKTQKKLKIALEKNDVKGFVKVLKHITFKDYVIYKLKMLIKRIVRI